MSEPTSSQVHVTTPLGSEEEKILKEAFDETTANPPINSKVDSEASDLNPQVNNLEATILKMAFDQYDEDAYDGLSEYGDDEDLIEKTSKDTGETARLAEKKHKAHDKLVGILSDLHDQDPEAYNEKLKAAIGDRDSAKEAHLAAQEAHVAQLGKETGTAPIDKDAIPDAATADDATPRTSIAQYDMLPSDALLAMDAMGYYWSDATSSGKGNREAGYPSQGALVEKGGPGSGPHPGEGKKEENTSEHESKFEYNANENSYKREYLADRTNKIYTEHTIRPSKNPKHEGGWLIVSRSYGKGWINTESTSRKIGPYKTKEDAMAASIKIHKSAEQVEKGGPGSGRYPTTENMQQAHLESRKNSSETGAALDKAEQEMKSAKTAMKSAMSKADTASDRAEPNPKSLADANEKINAYNLKAEAYNKALDAHHDTLKAEIHNAKTLLGKVEKGGPGSGPQRNGVIGKTESGKDIHANADHESHKDFTNNDHNDAALLHSKISAESKDIEDKKFHAEQGMIHINNLKSDEKIQVSQRAADRLKDAAKIKKSAKVPIMKINAQKQIVYGVVLTPNEKDLQKDMMLPEDIEKTAHNYLAKSRKIGNAHESEITEAYPVESYIAPQSFEVEDGPYGKQVVEKGAWILGVKVEDPDVWQKVVDGELTGFSVGGFGLREPLDTPNDLIQN